MDHLFDLMMAYKLKPIDADEMKFVRNFYSIYKLFERIVHDRYLQRKHREKTKRNNRIVAMQQKSNVEQ